MNFIPIFEKEDYALYAVKKQGEKVNVLKQLHKNWTDPKYLTDYFTKNLEKFHLYCPDMEVEQIVYETIRDANNLFSKFYAAESSRMLLDKLFTPFHDGDTSEEFVQMKVYGKSMGGKCKSWLRIYGVKQEGDYFVTGGLIKITSSMQKSDGGDDEKDFLDKVQLELMK